MKILPKLLLLAPFLLPNIVSAAVLIDIGPDGQRVESGALGLPGALNSGQNGNYDATSIGSGLTVTISALGANGSALGSIDWRDRGNSTSTQSLAQVGEDFVKNNAGIIRLTISGIAAGTYNAFGFHSDPEFSQSEAIKVLLETTPGNGIFAETGTPGDASSQVFVDGLTTAGLRAEASSFQFVSDGVNPLIVIFDGTAAADTEVPLAGFEYELVPEPSAVLLSSFGMVVMLLRRRRV